MADSNFNLYKRITDDPEFGAQLRSLFEDLWKEMAEGQEELELSGHERFRRRHRQPTLGEPEEFSWDRIHKPMNQSPTPLRRPWPARRPSCRSKTTC